MKTISRYIMTLALLITAVTGAWAADTYTVAGSNQDMFGTAWDPTNTANDMTKNGDGTYSITYTNVNLDDNVQYKVVKNHSWNEAYPDGDRVITIAEAGTYTLTIHFNPTTHEVYETMPGSDSGEPDVEVTTNAPSEQDLFTEASFKMPTFDADVNYELVRDLMDDDTENAVHFTGLPADGTTPIVVKKGSDGKYQPIEALTIQLIDPLAAAEAQNIIAADGITIKVLVGAENELGAIEFDQEPPITLEAFLADMKPGYYWIWAEASGDDSPYDGTAFSSQFTVVEKYDLLVKPANDFSKNGLDAVTVGTESVTIGANGKASKTGIDPETEVKIKAKRGYVIDKVEAKKGIAPPDPVTVTWNNLNFNSNPYTRDGVTLTTSNGAATGNNLYQYGDKTFTNTIGKFTKIEIVCEGNNFNGWAKESAGGYQVPEGPYIEVFKLTWTGNAESVTIPGGNYLYGISSITFTIQ